LARTPCWPGRVRFPVHAFRNGDADRGVVIAIDQRRLRVGLWQEGSGAWLDLGSAVNGLWQHIALVYDGESGALRGYVDGTELATVTEGLPSYLKALKLDASFGGVLGETRLSADRIPGADSGAYRGCIDEFHRFRSALDVAAIRVLAMRRPDATR